MSDIRAESDVLHELRLMREALEEATRQLTRVADRLEGVAPDPLAAGFQELDDKVRGRK